jgi:hypothetical protein
MRQQSRCFISFHVCQLLGTSGVRSNLAVAHLSLRFWTILLPLVLACVTSSVAAPAHVALIIASWPHTLSWMQSGVLAWSDDGVEEEKKQIGSARHEKGCHASQLLEKPCTAVEEEEETFSMRAACMHASCIFIALSFRQTTGIGSTH